jgi:hypothetical protein
VGRGLAPPVLGEQHGEHEADEVDGVLELVLEIGRRAGRERDIHLVQRRVEAGERDRARTRVDAGDAREVPRRDEGDDAASGADVERVARRLAGERRDVLRRQRARRVGHDHARGHLPPRPVAGEQQVLERQQHRHRRHVALALAQEPGLHERVARAVAQERVELRGRDRVAEQQEPDQPVDRQPVVPVEVRRVDLVELRRRERELPAEAGALAHPRPGVPVSTQLGACGSETVDDGQPRVRRRTDGHGADYPAPRAVQAAIVAGTSSARWRWKLQ